MGFGAVVYAECVGRVETAKIKACGQEEDDRKVQGQVELARGGRVAAHNGVHLEHSGVTAVGLVEALPHPRRAVHDDRGNGRLRHQSGAQHESSRQSRR